MGPAVTSEAVSCEQGERLRSSLSPNNTHSESIPSTGMSSDESVNSVERRDITACSSSRPVESSAGVLSPASSGQTTCSLTDLSKVVDSRLLRLSPKQHNVSFVNIKDVQGCQKMNIFLQNNPRTVLPNGGINCTSLSNEPKMVEVSASDETVPSGTVLPLQLELTALVNPRQSGNGISSGCRTRRMIIVPKSQTAERAGNPQQLESDSFSSIVAENDRTFGNASSVASELETESLQSQSNLNKTLTRQKMLSLRASRLLRRLRRLQCREFNSAIKEELGHLVSSLGQTVDEKASASVTQRTAVKDSLRDRDLMSLSTAELVNYVRKMQLSQLHCHSHRQPDGLGGVPRDDASDMTLNGEMQFSMCRTAGELISNARHLKSALDSDATESSSGGESCDEERPVSSGETSDITASRLQHRKLDNDWAKDRSSIISRWTWLQAQVSDLEYRIRQQNDIYKRLRLSKGSFSLRDPCCTTTGVPSNNGNLNGQIKANKLNTVADSEAQENSLSLDTPLIQNGVDSRDRFCTKLLSRTRQSNVAELLLASKIKPSDGDDVSEEKSVATPSSSLNSVRQQDALHSPTVTTSTTSSSANCLASAMLSHATPSYDPTCRAARCMELHGWRRRTLLRTVGLHEVSRKASQLSTVRCTCYPPVAPCALCGGRYDRVLRPDSTISTRDRLALLDPSYHSVLSFPKDVPLPPRMIESLWTGSVRIDSLTKHSSRPASVRVNNRLNSHSISCEMQQEDEGDEESPEGQPCLGRRIQSAAFCSRKASHRKIETMRKKKRLALNRKRLAKSDSRSSSLKSSSSHLLRRGYPTDVAPKRLSSRGTFDIDDVVIPSVTSATRVDIIHYKEIITPKWRRISKSAESAAANGDSVDASRVASRSVKKPRLSTASESDETKKVQWSSEELDPSKQIHASDELCGDEADDEDEIENLSDEAFAARHLRYEIYEKKQCMPVNVGHQRHSRSNRSESDSFTIPNPQSPDAGNLDASASLTSSTLSGGPSTSCLGYSDAEDPGQHHFGDSVYARQHSETKPTKSVSASTWSAAISASYGSEQLLERLEDRTVPAWPPRTFPLEDFENERLFSECPEKGYVHCGTFKFQRTVSPVTTVSTDSAEPIEEDPNDPEWTVMS